MKKQEIIAHLTQAKGMFDRAQNEDTLEDKQVFWKDCKKSIAEVCNHYSEVDTCKDRTEQAIQNILVTADILLSMTVTSMDVTKLKNLHHKIANDAEVLISGCLQVLTDGKHHIQEFIDRMQIMNENYQPLFEQI